MSLRFLDGCGAWCHVATAKVLGGTAMEGDSRLEKLGTLASKVVPALQFFPLLRSGPPVGG